MVISIEINIFVLMKQGGVLTILFFILIFSVKVNGQLVYYSTNGEVFFRSEAKLELIDAKSQKLEAMIDFQRKYLSF